MRMYKLLMADDEAIEREFLYFILNQNYSDVCEFCQVTTGRELIQKAASFKPDIVITNIKMPGINGIEAAKKILEIYPECKIILTSSIASFDYAKEAISLGIVDYLIKPISENLIVNAVNKSIKQIETTQMLRKRDEEINYKLKNITQYLSEELIFLLASGEIKEDVVKEMFQMLDIKSKAFISAIVSIPSDGIPDDITNELQKRLVKRRMEENLESKLHLKGAKFLHGSLSSNTLILILMDEPMSEYESRLFSLQLFNSVKDEIVRELYLNINIGIGNQCTAISDIYTSFLQAKTALKFDSAPGTIMCYGDISKLNKDIEYPVNKEKRLLEELLKGNENGCIQLLDELMDWMAIQLPSIDSIKQKTYELLFVLVREIEMNLSLLKIDENTEEIRKKIYLQESTRELNTFAKNYIKNIIKYMNNFKTTKANLLLSMVLHLIKNNYDKDISLESVSAKVNVSPFYLSKLFKRETGKNFIDYLTEYRLKKAKEHLLVPTYTVKDVCYLVGYKDPNYFARVFKKSCGVTPTEYRDNIYYQLELG